MSEAAYWQADQAINQRGVAIDLPAVQACISIVEQALAKYDAELHALTGGVVEAASQIQRLTGWLAGQGVHLASLDEEHIAAALAEPGGLPPDARRALELRALVGSASVKKLFSMANQVCEDGRLHDLFTYYGTRTGRCIAKGQLVLVLPPDGPPAWIPIETVSRSDRLWDGKDWVEHGGIVPQGAQEVIEHDGLRATPDHPVFTSAYEYARLEEVKVPLFRGEKPCPLSFMESCPRQDDIISESRLTSKNGGGCT